MQRIAAFSTAAAVVQPLATALCCIRTLFQFQTGCPLPVVSHLPQGAGCTPLVRRPATVLQLNIGLYCNQACRHCHVESSPK